MYTLYEENCMEVMERMEPESVDLILTDPPYNLSLFMRGRDTNLKQMRDNFFGGAGWDDLTADKWAVNMDRFFAQAARVVRPGGAMVVLMAVIRVETIIDLAQKNGFYYKTTGVWHKTNPMPRNMDLHFVNSTEAWIYFTYRAKTGTFHNEGRVVHDFFESSVAPAREKRFGKHPTQKPEALMEHFVRLLSNEGETVFDPFMGSGTTGVAAVRHGRRFVGAELNETYLAIAKKRIEEVEGNEKTPGS